MVKITPPLTAFMVLAAMIGSPGALGLQLNETAVTKQSKTTDLAYNNELD
jgi:hypothetical protein